MVFFPYLNMIADQLVQQRNADDMETSCAYQIILTHSISGLTFENKNFKHTRPMGPYMQRMCLRPVVIVER